MVHSVALSPELKVDMNLALPWSSFLINSPNQVATSSRKVFLGMPWHHTTPLCSPLIPLCGISCLPLSSEFSPTGIIAMMWCADEAKMNFTHIQVWQHICKCFKPHKLRALTPELVFQGEGPWRRGTHVRPQDTCRFGWERGAGLLAPRKPLSLVPETQWREVACKSHFPVSNDLNNKFHWKVFNVHLFNYMPVICYLLKQPTRKIQ